MPLSETISELIEGGHRAIRIVTDDEPEAMAAVVEEALRLGWPVSAWSATRGVYDGTVSGGEVTPNTTNAGAAMVMLRDLVTGQGKNIAQAPRLIVMLDAAHHLAEDKLILRSWRELIHAAQARNPNGTGTTVFMIDHSDSYPPVVKAMSTAVEVPLPDAEMVETIVRSTLRAIARELQTRGKALKADLEKEHAATILRNLQGLSATQIRRIIREVCLKDHALSIADLPAIMSAKRKLFESGGVLESVESPTSLSMIGGMHALKRWLAQREVTFTPRARELGLHPPRGVLLLGVQGAGKSLCAKAIATAWGRPLMRLDAGALYDRYVGESEKRLRNALMQAEQMAPLVLWIDEIEKAFAGAASTSTDGGLSRRMFGTLLTWMQEHTAAVFLAATANDIEALPPELLRKGRFDEIFFVDLPSAAAREAIFNIHLGKRKQAAATFDLPALVAASAGFSGAEIEQAIISSLSVAVSERAPLTTQLLTRTLNASPPLSVTMREKMDHLRRWAIGRCVPADDPEV
jgi:ATP-dependent 26S proteasome regulatory subunit